MLFRARFPEFARWLKAQGVMIQPTTSKWEVLRYRAFVELENGGSGTDAPEGKSSAGSQNGGSGKVCSAVIYRNADGRITFTGPSLTHWGMFLKGVALPTQPPETQKEVKKRASWTERTRAGLLERDGSDCYYCGKTMIGHDHTGRPTEDGKDDITIEHMLSQKVGRETGADVNHIDNLVLSHAKCNRDIGHQPVTEKLLYREIMHDRSTHVDHWEREDVAPPPRSRA